MKKMYLGVRVLVQSNKNLILNIPQLWVKNMGVDAGSVLDVFIEADGSLTLKAIKIKGVKK